MNWHIPHPVKNEFIIKINGISLTLKREDQLHPLISGNKFRKLKYNFLEMPKDIQGIFTFGGAYSNHLVATAAAGRINGIATYGFVRGEELHYKERNPSLKFCESQGMELHFLTREEYTLKEQATVVKSFCENKKLYALPEGGTNKLAIKGCEEILTPQDAFFDTVCCAVGTGGTLMGLIKSAQAHQHVLGFLSVLDQKVSDGLARACPKETSMTLIDDYVMGGYGKVPEYLVNFINSFYKKHKILLDPLYTGKLLFGIFALIKNDQWRWGDNVLIIHTGGIQGIEGFNQQQRLKKKPCIHF